MTFIWSHRGGDLVPKDCSRGDQILSEGLRTMTSEMEELTKPRKKLSCTKYFDALYFCYSPVHQLQQYYRAGSLDNCFAKWSALFDCLVLKTKSSSEVEKILKSREETQKHIWSFRSPEEARRHWNLLFGHLSDEE